MPAIPRPATAGPAFRPLEDESPRPALRLLDLAPVPHEAARSINGWPARLVSYSSDQWARLHGCYVGVFLD